MRSTSGFKEISGSFWSVVKRGARNRNIIIDINSEYAYNLLIKQDYRCAFTNLKIGFKDKNCYTASLDRINNDLGYIEGNVQWVTKEINRMKWSSQIPDFLEMCNKVVHFYSSDQRYIPSNFTYQKLREENLSEIEVLINNQIIDPMEKAVILYTKYNFGTTRIGRILNIPVATIKYRLRKSTGLRTIQDKTYRGSNHPLWKGFKGISGQFWNVLRNSAKRRNLEVSIAIQDLWRLFEIQNGICNLTGDKLIIGLDKLGAEYITEINASVDRIDSSKGYTLDNIQWVTKLVNTAKTDLNDDVFYNFCKLVSFYNYSIFEF